MCTTQENGNPANGHSSPAAASEGKQPLQEQQQQQYGEGDAVAKVNRRVLRTGKVVAYAN